jgi:hypothetical protein
MFINENLQTLDKVAEERLKGFLGILSVIEAVSDVVGIDFAKDMRDWHEMSKLIIDMYNSMVESKLTYLGMPELRPIKLDSLKPSKAIVKYIQDRLALSLGEGWQDAREAMLRDLAEKEAEDGQKEPA